jgi:uncharacterized protein YdcH (DUF465 family)
VCAWLPTDAIAPPQVRSITCEEVDMFENQQRDDIEAMMKADANFRRLYHHHQKLDSKVHDAEIGVLPIDDLTLVGMKKEKLQAKARLQRMWDDLRGRTH